MKRPPPANRLNIVEGAGERHQQQYQVESQEDDEWQEGDALKAIHVAQPEVELAGQG